jgi:zinc transport system substrate-binding protein
MKMRWPRSLLFPSRHCEEATPTKQSIHPSLDGWIASSLALLAMTFIVSVTAPAHAAVHAAAPDVVVSIKPIHSLVAGVMAGVGEPRLIVGGASSPHTYSLKPSDAEALSRARLVVWVGPTLEGFLAKPLQALAGAADIVELDRAPEVHVWRARVGGLWEADTDAPKATAIDADGHLWLDPDNAKAIVDLVAAKLATLDPEHAERYAANAQALDASLTALDARLRVALAPVHDVPFVVFHDGYQYLERRYGLDAIGSITVDPEHQPGARRIEEIRAKIASSGARCVFAEPEFTPTLVRTVVAGTPAREATLDGLGAALPPGPALYVSLMRGLGDALTACLGAR